MNFVRKETRRTEGKGSSGGKAEDWGVGEESELLTIRREPKRGEEEGRRMVRGLEVEIGSRVTDLRSGRLSPRLTERRGTQWGVHVG